MYMLLLFFHIAGVFVLLNAEFLAACSLSYMPGHPDPVPLRGDASERGPRGHRTAGKPFLALAHRIWRPDRREIDCSLLRAGFLQMRPSDACGLEYRVVPSELNSIPLSGALRGCIHHPAGRACGRVMLAKKKTNE